MKIINEKTKKIETIRAFLDTGSQMTVISEDCVEKCGLPISKPEIVKFGSFQNKAKVKSVSHSTVNLYTNTPSLNGNLQLTPFVMKNVIDPIKTYPLSKQQLDFLDENNIKLADPEINSPEKLKVDLLIGQDYVNHFFVGGSQFLPGGSSMFESWNKQYVITGPIDVVDAVISDRKPACSPQFFMVNQCLRHRATFQDLGYSRKISEMFSHAYACVNTEDELETLEQFRSLEVLGIAPSDFDISPILEEFNDSARLVNGRYLVKLPVKEPQITNLSNNFFQAFTRLLSGLKRRKKPKFLVEGEKYQKSFKDELSKGILEKVEVLGTIDEICDIIRKNPYYFNNMRLENGKYCCYLPHQAVYKLSNGKFRRVHDAKAKPGKGTYSLNDCLNKGPNLIATILQVLLGFRKNRFGFAADIEKAFPTVAIEEQHRDLLRCLWVEGDQVVIYRFARLPFGLSCSPFLLQATLRKHLGDNNVSDELMTQFTGACYMDDLVSSEETIEDLQSKKEYITSLFGECGMLFRDWNCNDKVVREMFAQTENKNVDDLDEQLILGIKWDTINDTLRINGDRLIEKIRNEVKTKRDMWGVIPSLFDPLGLLSPYCLLGKKIVMEACKEVKAWDQRMPRSHIDKLLNWAKDFDKIEDIQFPRFAGIENPAKLELYGCSDASSYAFGACIYLVATDQEGKKHVNLVMGRPEINLLRNYP